jgi:hypothetical protein
VKMPRVSARIVTALALLALLMPILAACGGAPNSNATLPTAAVKTPAETKPTAAPVPTTMPTTAALAPTTTNEAPTANQGQPTAPPGTGDLTGPLMTPYLQFGVIDHLYYTDRERVLTLTNNAGFDWVRQQVVWKDIEGPQGNYAWGELDNIVNDVAAHDLKLLVSIVQSPSFYTADGKNGLPQDPKSLGDFVEAMAKHYGDKIGAYEIWNEQNLAHENGGHVTTDDAGHYVEILAECYKRIKSVTPAAFVLAGPPSSSGVNDPNIAVSDENYYRAMYNYKNGMIKQFFDAQAVHPGGAANPPDTFFPENPSRIEGCDKPSPDHCWNDHPTHYFRHVEDVRRFMEEEGVGDHQIWITEFGWATKNNTPGYEFGNFVSFDQQADYITGAIKRVYQQYRYPDGSSWVGVMFLWNMNFAVLWGGQGNPEHEQASFGILNPDWSPRPSFTAAQGLIAQIKQKQNR